MIKIKSDGKFDKTAKYLKDISGQELINTEIMALRKYATDIVHRLQDATPKDTGRTAASWYYKMSMDGNKVKLDLFNANVQDGACVAILIQYGHGTPSGTYVKGIDYINPAVKPYFDKIEDVVWKEVAK